MCRRMPPRISSAPLRSATANITRSPSSTPISSRSAAISSSEKNLTIGLFTEPSSRNAIQARPLAPKSAATFASLSICARGQAPAPLALMALTYWPSVAAALAKSLNLEVEKIDVTSWSSMPKRVSGLSEP